MLQVLGDLLRQSGQVERALALRQQVLQRRDLTRARARARAGRDGHRLPQVRLPRPRLAHVQEVLETDPGNLQALSEIEKLQEEQRQWPEAYETRTRLARLRKTDDSLVLGHLQAEMGREALAAGRTDEAERAFRTALSARPARVPRAPGPGRPAGGAQPGAGGRGAGGRRAHRPRPRLPRVRPAGPLPRRGRPALAVRGPVRSG